MSFLLSFAAPAGPAGAPGAPGPAGSPSTVPGPAGSIGPAGPQGPAGAAGAPGPASTVPGPAGPAGATGNTGATGPQGPAGLTGPASTVPGPTGPVGATGATGNTGATGPQGPAGLTGPASTVPGPTGPAGAQGVVGNTGPAGASPYFVADWGTVAAVNPATNGLAAFDSVTPLAGQRILLAALGPNAGIWVASVGPWARAADYSTDAQIRQSVVRVTSWAGSALGFGATISNTNTSAITVGTTAIAYTLALMQNGNTVREGLWGPGGQTGYEGYSNGGNTPTHSQFRASGANGSWVFQNFGTGIIGFGASGGVRLGNFGAATPILDHRAATAAIPAGTSVAAGATYTLAVAVAGSLPGSGICHASTQGVAVPAGLVFAGAWCAVAGTVTVGYRNDTAAAIAWPATATNVRALWLSI